MPAQDVGLPFDPPLPPDPIRRCPVCNEWLARPFPEGTMTYAMQRQGWVKIGRSYQVEVRRKVLSMPSPGCRVIAPEGMEWSEPILLLRTWPGNVEHDLHVRWADCHAAGEWFMPDAAMRAWLAAP